MKELDVSIQNKINALMEKANKAYNTQNFADVIYTLKEAWNILPKPPKLYDDSYRIAKHITRISLKIKDYETAEKWANILQTCNLTRIDSGEREFILGQVMYEKNDIIKAKALFTIAHKKSDGRCFRNEDKKYRRILLA